MASIRFTQILKACGTPENHLILGNPNRDGALQGAIKTNRVLTIHQEATGSRADWGEIGFSPGHSRQFLLFRKTLNQFEGKVVVGIKYELVDPALLLTEKEGLHQGVKKGDQAAASEPRSKLSSSVKHEKPQLTSKKAEPIPFSADNSGQPTVENASSSSPEISHLKSGIRRAIKLLRQGKQVAAFSELEALID